MSNLAPQYPDDHWLLPAHVALSRIPEKMSRRKAWGLPGQEPDALLWTFPKRDHRYVTAADGPLLEEFVRLADQPPATIRDFAQRWGVLGICEHDMISTHHRAGRPAQLRVPAVVSRHVSITKLDGSKADGWWRSGPSKFWRLTFFGGCYLRELKPWLYWEPLAVWRDYSRKARAVLNIAAKLQSDQLGDENDWRTILGSATWDRPDPKEYYPEDTGDVRQAKAIWEERFTLGNHISQQWLRLGQVRPILVWEHNTPRMVFGNGTLFGALAMSLALAPSRTGGLGVCARCGTYFIPKRQPVLGRRQYCESCGKPAALRDAQADTQRRKRKAWELRAQGLSIRKIANRVGSREKTVRRWVSGMNRDGTSH